MSEDIRGRAEFSRIGSYLRKKARLVYERDQRVPLDLPVLRGVVVTDAGAEIPMGEPEEMEPVNRSRYVPHRWRP